MGWRRRKQWKRIQLVYVVCLSVCLSCFLCPSLYNAVSLFLSPLFIPQSIALCLNHCVSVYYVSLSIVTLHWVCVCKYVTVEGWWRGLNWERMRKQSLWFAKWLWRSCVGWWHRKTDIRATSAGRWRWKWRHISNAYVTSSHSHRWHHRATCSACAACWPFGELRVDWIVLYFWRIGDLLLRVFFWCYKHCRHFFNLLQCGYYYLTQFCIDWTFSLQG